MIDSPPGGNIMNSIQKEDFQLISDYVVKVQNTLETRSEKIYNKFCDSKIKKEINGSLTHPSPSKFHKLAEYLKKHEPDNYAEFIKEIKRHLSDLDHIV